MDKPRQVLNDRGFEIKGKASDRRCSCCRTSHSAEAEERGPTSRGDLRREVPLRENLRDPNREGLRSEDPPSARSDMEDTIR